MKIRSLRAALTWIDGEFEEGVRITIAPDGTIGELTRDPGPVDLELSDEALLPGLVNAHSHSFQRAMRGRTEHFPAGRGSFWTWREAMYSLVESLSEQQFHDWNVAAFREMRSAGITTVGEFHYFHHSSASARDHRLDSIVLDAAEAAGIRIVLLQTFYRMGGFGQPLGDAQARFETPDVDEFLRRLDQLQETLRPRQSVGIVAHSVRAVPIEDLVRLASAAVERDLPFHLHLEEQEKEISDCIEATGSRPMRLVLDRAPVDQHFTGVHCTHSSEDDLREWVARGGNVCITPLTEGNLGDGIQPLAPLAPDHMSIGTDCNARIDMLEELRWLEYGQRLLRQDRGVYRDASGENARVLLKIGTAGGAASLRVHAGEIAPGLAADFFTVDLRHPALAGWERSRLAASIVFGGGNEIVLRNCVAGEWTR